MRKTIVKILFKICEKTDFNTLQILTLNKIAENPESGIKLLQIRTYMMKNKIALRKAAEEGFEE